MKKEKVKSVVLAAVSLLVFGCIITAILISPSLGRIGSDAILTGGDIILLKPENDTGRLTSQSGYISSALSAGGYSVIPLKAGDTGIDALTPEMISWEQEQTLDIFSNPKFGGQSIVAPGSFGSYCFYIKNASDFSVTYSLTVTDDNEYKVPLQYRLRTAEKYLVGSETEWFTIGELVDKISYYNALNSNAQQPLYLDWMWKYEDGRDTEDTQLGNAAVTANVSYLLSMRVQIEQTSVPQTGGILDNFSFMLVCVGVSFMIIVVIIVKKIKEKKDEKSSQNI